MEVEDQELSALDITVVKVGVAEGYFLSCVSFRSLKLCNGYGCFSEGHPSVSARIIMDEQ